jgi:hypothetical protein
MAALEDSEVDRALLALQVLSARFEVPGMLPWHRFSTLLQTQSDGRCPIQVNRCIDDGVATVEPTD